jgi:hypothetical protein
LSKFSDRLSNLGQSGPARMGFGKSAAREKNPVMLVIGRGGDSENDAKSVDLLLRTEARSDSEGEPWGLAVGASTAVDAETLENNGCQFLIFESEDASAAGLLAEELGKGIEVTDGLPEHRVRALEDGPFDFFLYRPAEIKWPLTVGSALKLQDLISCFSKHIFLELSDLPGKADLEVLKNLPVSAVIVDLGKVSSADAAKLKEEVGKLEPRKPNQGSERSAFLPASGRATSESFDEGDDGFEGGGDDDDWDDE